MRIHLSITGGMGPPLAGSLNIEELPEDVAASARTELTPRALAAAERRPRNPLQTELQTYELALIGDETKVFRFDETQCTEPLLELLDQLTSALRSKLIAASRHRPD